MCSIYSIYGRYRAVGPHMGVEKAIHTIYDGLRGPVWTFIYANKTPYDTAIIHCILEPFSRDLAN